jgi:hypothetical protein
VLAVAQDYRRRDKAHLKYVALQPCLVCGRAPSDPHHLTFAQPRALGAKVSDEFTVPLCRIHHRALHRFGSEVAWWLKAGLEPLVVARTLWENSRRRIGQSPASASREPGRTDFEGSSAPHAYIP